MDLTDDVFPPPDPARHGHLQRPLSLASSPSTGMPSIRFIDPSFCRSNPSASGLIDVALRLVDDGWTVEIFAAQIDADLVGKVKFRKAPLIRLPFGMAAWGYHIYYNLQVFRDYLSGNLFNGLTVSAGFFLLSADLATVHFSHFDSISKSCLHGRKQPGFLTDLIKSLPGLITECIFLWNPWKTKLLAVSYSVAEDILRFGAPWKEVKVFPNTFSQKDFSRQVCLENRSTTRSSHGFSDYETVFLFSSMGHYFRKGIYLAADAVSELRRRGHPVRMLMVGGLSSAHKSLRKNIASRNPGYEDWLVMTGMVDNPKIQYSAADALFFPSLSEAFSLVEIEAAALGLPLFLTPHHGSEMILKDGVNGRLLPWDAKGMADVLEAEILKGISPTSGGTGLALSKEDYYSKFRSYLDGI
jgi:glycosyltransferase involved in cell wall biosynthesis